MLQFARVGLQNSRYLLTGTTRSYSSGIKYLDSLNLDLETVPLAFDKHPAPADVTKKAPIVFCHGLFGNKLNNRSVSRELAKLLHRDVYCVDLRNHGDSPHIARHDYPSLAADVERFCHDHNLQKPILIGHSMGAKTVMGAALRRPELPSLVISVDNAPMDNTGGSTGFNVFGVYIRELIKIVNQTKPVIKSLKEADLVMAKVEKSLPVRQFLLSNLKRRQNVEEGEPIFTSRVPFEIIGKNLDNISGFPYNGVRWTGPSLFVRGDMSKYVPDDVFDKISTFFPRFEVKDVHAGHWLISENPKEFVKTVTEWIEKIEDDEAYANRLDKNLFK